LLPIHLRYSKRFLPYLIPNTSQNSIVLESLDGLPDLFEYVDEALGDKLVSGKYQVLGYRVL
jgi:hypothetical protein